MKERERDGKVYHGSPSKDEGQEPLVQLQRTTITGIRQRALTIQVGGDQDRVVELVGMQNHLHACIVHNEILHGQIGVRLGQAIAAFQKQPIREFPAQERTIIDTHTY